jgi:hypothetical protein
LVLVAAGIAPAHAGSGHKNLIKIYFLNTGVQPQAGGKVQFMQNPAQNQFKIKVSHMTPGVYDVVVNGAVVDALTVNPDGCGKVQYRMHFKNHRMGGPLPYDPRGAEVGIQAAGVILLEASVPSTPEEAFEKIEISTELVNLGVISGTARAQFKMKFGRMQFEVEMNGAIPGTYELLVDGVKKADIVVGADGHGEVEFDSRPSSDDEDGDDALDLPLTFDPRGASIVIQQAAVADFSGTLPLIQTP